MSVVDNLGTELSSSAKNTYYKYLDMFQKIVINTDFEGVPDDSSFTTKLFKHCTKAIREALSRYIRKIECKCIWINKPKKDKSWSGRTYTKSNYIGKVTIYPNSRDKMKEIDEKAFYDLFVISENVLYFTLKSMGIPYIVCKGWIVNINDKNKYDIDKMKSKSNAIKHYLNEKKYSYTTKHVSLNRGYSHLVKVHKKKSKQQTQKSFGMTLRSKSNKNNSDKIKNSNKRKLSPGSELEEREIESPPQKKRKLSRRKHK